MKRIISSKFYLLFIGIGIILMFFFFRNKNASYNEIRCETTSLPINGVITKIDGRTGYMDIFIDNKMPGISFDVESVKFKKGFDEYHDFGVGDSIHKNANSKEVLIKNGDSVCILVLKCDD